ncbi:hypothetical protein HPB50_026386 [Hyalomma asiaticum]|uniref:Uncharacterized protein n=1 Tax=Hyalomma asiaticum TaxID=266040 RepID=A0ACB7TP74_HYAAI|nr:hypothetical protein HPB50_026386 [Hyalomma asiaticum]
MAPATVSPAQASTFRWEVSQPETWRNHLTHPAEWFRDVLGIIGWRAPLGSLASLDSSSRWQGAVVVRPSPRGLPSRAPGFDPCGRPPPLARTHRSRPRTRARGQWRPPHVTADVVALRMAFLCTELLGGKRNALFWWGLGKEQVSAQLKLLYKKLATVLSSEDLQNVLAVCKDKYENIFEATREKQRAMFAELLEEYELNGREEEDEK